jgi:histidinol phosphatase-like PHP family hydrolase
MHVHTYIITHAHTPLQQLKEKVSVQEYQFSSLVEHGRALLDSMDPGTEAEQFMDGKLSTLEQRWTDLVSQVHMVPWSKFT